MTRHGTHELDTRILAAVNDAIPLEERNGTQIDGSTHLEADLGLDSLGVLALLYRLRWAFGVEDEDDPEVDVGAIRTVEDLIRAARAELAPALRARLP